MLIKVESKNLPFFEALASETRIEIIHILAKGELNIKELAEKVNISSPMMIKHIKKLEEAGIVSTKMIRQNGSIHKICTLLPPEYRLEFPAKDKIRGCHEVHIPVGCYSDIEASPTCGLATENEIIGYLDDQRFFWDSAHVNAQIIWFTKGFVNYTFPNYLSSGEKPIEIEITFEISSEAPDFNDDWPSDIQLTFNEKKLVKWTSPGDFGEKQGIFTPFWWPSNQYGILKTIIINEKGSFIDGQNFSQKNINDFIGNGESLWTLRFEVLERNNISGGLTLFGKKFGNYAQDIIIRTFYTKLNTTV